MSIPLILSTSFHLLFCNVLLENSHKLFCLFQVEYGRVVECIPGVSRSEVLLERVEVTCTSNTFLHRVSWMLWDMF